MFNIKNTKPMTYSEICNEASSLNPYCDATKDVITIQKGVLFTWNDLVGALYHNPDRIFLRDVANEFYEIGFEEEGASVPK